MGLLALFLLVAAGTAIDSNSLASHGVYEGKPGFEAAVGHVFYGLNFAVVVIGLLVVALIAAALVLGLVILYILLALDRVIKPLNAIDAAN